MRDKDSQIDLKFTEKYNDLEKLNSYKLDNNECVLMN